MRPAHSHAAPVGGAILRKNRMPSQNFARRACLTAALAALPCLAQAPLATSAYRALGQTDFRQNGVNRVFGMELHAPQGLALDEREGRVRLYVADTRNNRVLGWADARSFQSGEPAALVLGQPSGQHSAPMGIGARGLNAPMGLAVDARTGHLYVADTGNHRVLRFPSPFANPTRIEPDAVYGQSGFTARTPNPNGVTRNSMNAPRALAFDPLGNLWVADSGNNRVLRFPSGSLENANPDADLVVGQPDFNTAQANRGGNQAGPTGFDTPAGLAFDAQGNLYVSDRNNSRVLKFNAPFAPNASAAAVIGQPDFTTRAAPGEPGGATLAGPAGLAVDSSGKLYVADPNDNRAMIFPANSSGMSSASELLGQLSFTSVAPNADAFPQASASSFFGVTDVKVDSEGNIYVADTGNNRVLAFPPNSRSAARVWGQIDFSSNGANQIKAGSISAPFEVAIDYSRAPYALYASDTGNHRVLVWKDAVRFRSGDPADMAIGQPDLRTGVPNGDTRNSQRPSATSLSSPKGVAVDRSGNLYVVDSGNHRVLRYPRPVDQTGRVTPDAVLGQPDFNSANSAAVGAATLRSPTAVALSPDGNVFVSDTGNNRVLEFAAGAGSGAAAIRVYGQPQFNSAVTPASASAQTLSAPTGIFVDAGFNLYVADTGAHRVLIFPNTQTAPPAGAVAAYVIGQDRFDVSVPANLAGSLSSPTDVAADSLGTIYVCDSGGSRVLAYPSLLFLPAAGGAPTGVVGQRDAGATGPNWNSPDGLATAEGLSNPLGIFVDRQDTLYVGDTGNNRLLHFLRPGLAVSAAHFQSGAPVSPGGLVTLFGEGLAENEAQATEAPWPFSLAGRELVVNDDLKAALLYIGPRQVNFQMPSAAPTGLGRVALRSAETGELIAGAPVSVAAAAPALFTAGMNGQGAALALNQDGSRNSTASPAEKGSVIVLYGTGQGPVSPPVPDGAGAPSGTLAATVAVPTSDGRTCLTSQPSVCVAIGSSFGDIQFSGLAPGFVGLWQLNVRVPEDSPSGAAVPVRAIINGAPSNIVTVSIR